MGWPWPALLLILTMIAGVVVSHPASADDRRPADNRAESSLGNSLVAPSPAPEGQTALDSLLRWTERLIDVIPDAGEGSARGECEAGMQRCCCGGDCYCKKECSLKPCR
jgi:hypothetical protein